MIDGVLLQVVPPEPLIIIAQGWPSFLISALAMKLPIAGAYFPASFHEYFDKTKSRDLTWYTPDDLKPSLIGGTLLVSGSLSFLQYIARRCQPTSAIFCLEFRLRGTNRHAIQRHHADAKAALSSMGFTPFTFLHASFGGSTSASHVLGFSASLLSDRQINLSPVEVPRSISHFLNAASQGQFSKWITVPTEDSFTTESKVSWLDPDSLSYSTPRGDLTDSRLGQRWKQVLDCEGLLPMYDPGSLVATPSVFGPPNKWCVRSITVLEALRIFSIPAFMDSSFENTLDPGIVRKRLPFEDAVSPDIIASIFRQLWEVSDVGVNEVSFKSAEADPQLNLQDELCPSVPASSVSEALPDRAEEVVSLCTEGTPVSSLTASRDERVEVEDVEAGLLGTNAMHDKSVITVADVELVGAESAPGGTSDEAEKDPLTISDQTGHDDDTVVTNNLSVRKLVEQEQTTEEEEKDEASDTNMSDSDETSVSSSPLLLHPSFAAPSSSLQSASNALNISKAVKADDAEVPVHLWDEKVFTSDYAKDLQPSTEEQKLAAVATLRRFALKIYWKNLLKDCLDRLRTNFGADWYTKPRSTSKGKSTLVQVEVHALSNVMWHATEADWFEYHRGSQLHYFRFPPIYQKMARDGVRVFFEKKGPTSKRAARPIEDPVLRAKVRKKLEKVINRAYIVEAGISLKSLIKYFPVPKGEDDIRIVYDATANELNEAVWVPSFWLPTVESMLRALDPNSFMLDRDIGEQFLNFPLHETAWAYTGLDLGPIMGDSSPSPNRWYHWVRCLMGFSASPYIAVKMTLICEEVARGDRHDLDNPFHWSYARLNLPGTPNYTPTQSWFSKIREDGRVAADVFTFVDDERITGPDEDLTWKAGHRLACIQAYLGIQDAARKLRRCSQEPGAWAGSVVHVLPEFGVCVLTSPEKWDKLKSILKKWLTRVERGDEKLDHKELLSDRGFLVYVTRTYPSMVPYLKGFHLTIEHWRGGRDLDGWKLKTPLTPESESQEDFDDVFESAAIDHKLQEDLDEERSRQDAPKDGVTNPVPRFRDDLIALSNLASFDLPPLRLVRGKVVFTALYGFGDASGKGFGSTTARAEGSVRYRLGVWGKDAEDESSNYRELRNLVEAAEEEARKGNLSNTEFFLFTDNITAESCFHRGNSSSKLLHELVLRLRLLEIQHSVIIHVIHISGKRMMAQGTDGCSRGSRLEGVMAGADMLSFIDLSRNAIERQPLVLDWVRKWTGIDNLSPLKVEDWFDKGHGVVGGTTSSSSHGIWIPEHESPGKTHLWTPPPAIADVALEELLKARHKRHDTFHVILIPRLMTPRWRRLFNKVCDFSFSVPVSKPFWPESMYEPLWVGIVLPFTHHRPWQLKRAPLLVDLGRQLHEVLHESSSDGGDILRELWSLPKRLSCVPKHVASGMLRMPRAEEVPYARSSG